MAVRDVCFYFRRNLNHLRQKKNKPYQHFTAHFIAYFHHLLLLTSSTMYLTIIPRARMGSESIDSEGHEGESNNCLSKIQLVGQKYRDKTTLAS